MVGTKGIPAKWGGIEKYIEEISSRLVIRGHSVTVFGSKWFTKSYPHSKYRGIIIQRIPTLHLQASDALTNAFFATVRIVLGKYDIVHFHGFASFLYMPIIKLFGKKTVVTVHAMESNWQNEKYGFFGKNIIKKAFRCGIRHADRITTVADHLSDKIFELNLIRPKVLSSGIDNPVHLDPYIINQKYGLKGHDYLLFLGRIDPIKRVDWLLDIVPMLNNDLFLVIAGGAQDSDTQFYYKTMKDIVSSKSSKKVIFTGPVWGDEKAELLGNCLLFLAPSRDEGLPITVLEASSYGRCTLASDIPAHRSVIEEGVTGFLFPRDEKKSMISKVLKLISEREILIKLGLEAKESCQSRFNWERTVDDLINVYIALSSENCLNTKKESF